MSTHDPREFNWDTLITGGTQIEWLIEPIVPAGKFTMLYADASQGKSWLALWWAYEQAIKGLSICYIDNEMDEQDLIQRMTEFGGKQHLPELHQNLHYSFHTFNDLLEPQNREHLMEWVTDHSPDLVVFDTFMASIIGDENTVETIQAFRRDIAQPLKDTGAAVLIIDHAGKNPENQVRGSSAKKQAVDVMWKVSLHEAVGNMRDLSLYNEKGRSGKMPKKARYTIYTEPDKIEFRQAGDWYQSEDDKEERALALIPLMEKEGVQWEWSLNQTYQHLVEKGHHWPKFLMAIAKRLVNEEPGQEVHPEQTLETQTVEV